MLREAHRVHSHHSQREDLSVSLSSSVSDRTGRPVGDRTGRPVEQRNQEAQIRTLLDNQKEECQARINRHEFQAAYDRRSLLKLGELTNLNEKNFIALELKKFNNEINSSFNLPKAHVQFSVLRLHRPEVDSEAKDMENCRFTLLPLRKQLRLFFA